MSASTREPTSIVAGDSATWIKSLPQYPPSDGWSLTYYLIVSDDTEVIAATTVGADFSVTIPASVLEDTASPFTARLTGRVSKDAERYTIYDAPLSVAPDPASAGLSEGRSATQVELDAVRTALLEVATSGGMVAYTIAGRSVQVDVKWLTQREVALVARLRSEQGLGFRHHRVAFGVC